MAKFEDGLDWFLEDFATSFELRGCFEVDVQNVIEQLSDRPPLEVSMDRLSVNDIIDGNQTFNAAKAAGMVLADSELSRKFLEKILL